MSKNYIFSSESVGEGHPDKVCDTISDAILDACLSQDKFSRVACEAYAKSNLVVVGGEITTKAKLDYNAVARQAIRDIGYTHEDDVFHADRSRSPSAKATRTKFVTPFQTRSSTPACRRTNSAGSPAKPMPRATSWSWAGKSPPKPNSTTTPWRARRFVTLATRTKMTFFTRT